MLRSILPLAAFFVYGIVQPSGAAAQPARTARDTTIDAATRAQIIDSLIVRLDAGYVFPDKAAEMARDLRARVERGTYESLTSAIGFADSLTAHLQSVSHDKHLRVTYSDRVLPSSQQGPTPEQQQQMRDRMKADNYGVGTPELLDGNVAYLELRTFGVSPEMIGEALAEAMTKVADADALIIDVRRNGGGSPWTVALVSS